MPKKKTESIGVEVRTDQPRNARYEDGVPVLRTRADRRGENVPEQTAGAKKAGQSAEAVDKGKKATQ